MCVCVCVCVCVCMCVCIPIHIYTYKYIHTCTVTKYAFLLFPFVLLPQSVNTTSSRASALRDSIGRRVKAVVTGQSAGKVSSYISRYRYLHI